jgi:hypothetical protein
MYCATVLRSAGRLEEILDLQLQLQYRVVHEIVVDGRNLTGFAQVLAEPRARHRATGLHLWPKPCFSAVSQTIIMSHFPERRLQ